MEDFRPFNRGEPSDVSAMSDRSLGGFCTVSREESSHAFMKTYQSKEGRELSCVSAMSDRSLGGFSTLSKEESSHVFMKTYQSKEGRELSRVSEMSHWSMLEPPGFSSGGGEPSRVSINSYGSIGDSHTYSRGELSRVSAMSDRSLLGFSALSKEESSHVFMKTYQSIEGREPSRVSLMHDRSMLEPPGFSSGGGEPSRVSINRYGSIGDSHTYSRGEPSRVSAMSDRSVRDFCTFSREESSHVFMKTYQSIEGRELSRVSLMHDRSMFEPPGLSSGEGEPSHYNYIYD